MPYDISFTLTAHTSNIHNHILLIMSMTMLHFAATKEWFLPSENYSNCLAAFCFYSDF